jgi:hypothetical protein
LKQKNNEQIILSGDYVFYNNAAVLQTNKNVYGIISNESKGVKSKTVFNQKG